MFCASLCLVRVAADLNFTTIFKAGTFNHSCYRVPGAVRAPSGALLVFVEARGPSCDDQAPKDIMMSRSDDEGTTWAASMVVPGFSLDGVQTFRNPYPVFTERGLLLLNCVNTTVEPWVSLQLTSSDNGMTWSPPAPLTKYLGAFDGILAGPGSGLTLTSPLYRGRVLACGTTVYQPNRTFDGATVWASDDSGDSWVLATQVWNDMQECQLAELHNGSVLINFRAGHVSPCDCRSQSRSDDGGKTWTPLAWQPVLIEPVCSAGLQQTSSGLYFSNPASTTQRINMTVRRSADGGSSWPESVQVWAGSAAYSCLVPVGDPVDGDVGIVYEQSAPSFYGIVFSRVPTTMGARAAL